MQKGSIPPIFIPSRGRAHCSRGTLHSLVAAGIPATVVVEPHEVDQYQKLIVALQLLHQEGNQTRQQQEVLVAAGSDETARIDEAAATVQSCPWKVASLPLSDQGVSFVRNHILKTLAPPGGWFWVMDDDIRDFYRADGKTNQKISVRDMIGLVGKRAMQYPDAAIFSLEYAFFAYSYSDGSVAINSYNNIAVLFNKALLPPQLEYRWRIREDYDFTLQLIRAGGKSVRFRNLSFNVPRMADVKGGMTDFYETKKKEIREANDVFVAEWPSVSREVIKGTGDKLRYDIQVKWMLLNPTKCRDPIAVLQSKTPLPPVVESRAAANRKRSRGKKCESSCSTTESGSSDEQTESSSSEESDDFSDKPNLGTRRTRRTRPAEKRERPPKAPAPPREKVPAGWKGYTLVEWRDVPDVVAEDVIGLHKMDPHDVKLGTQCAIIPVWPSVPQNLVVVTVIGVARRSPVWEWTGVVDKMRGVPLQTFGSAFVVPPDIAEKDAAIGAWLTSTGVNGAVVGDS